MNHNMIIYYSNETNPRFVVITVSSYSNNSYSYNIAGSVPLK